MTNKEINDATRDLVYWYRKWREVRPLNYKNSITAYDELSDVIDAYSHYSPDGVEINAWVANLGCAWLRGLQRPENSEGIPRREWLCGKATA